MLSWSLVRKQNRQEWLEEWTLKNSIALDPRGVVKGIGIVDIGSWYRYISLRILRAFFPSIYAGQPHIHVVYGNEAFCSEQPCSATGKICLSLYLGLSWVVTKWPSSVAYLFIYLFLLLCVGIFVSLPVCWGIAAEPIVQELNLSVCSWLCFFPSVFTLACTSWCNYCNLHLFIFTVILPWVCFLCCLEI